MPGIWNVSKRDTYAETDTDTETLSGVALHTDRLPLWKTKLASETGRVTQTVILLSSVAHGLFAKSGKCLLNTPMSDILTGTSI